MQDLKKAALFHELSDAQLAALGEKATRQTTPKKQVLFFEKDRGDSMFILLKGSVKVSAKTEDGQSKVLAILQAGDAFGELTLIDNRPRSATVETLEDCELIRIDHHAFREFTKGNPEVLWKIMQSLCGRVRLLSDKALALAYEEVPYRLVKTLSQLAEKADTGDDTATLHLNAGELSDLVGADKRTTTRIIRQLVGQGLVESRTTALYVPSVYALNRALDYARDWY